jgi:hypothetical protein
MARSVGFSCKGRKRSKDGHLDSGCPSEDYQQAKRFAFQQTTALQKDVGLFSLGNKAGEVLRRNVQQKEHREVQKPAPRR